MFNPFKQLSDLNQLRQQAQQIQRGLAEEKIEIVKDNIRLVISGEQKVETVEINGIPDEKLKNAINEAIRKSQEVAARKLQNMTGGLSGLLK